ncbi:pyridoxamine 5'-phosphate oxidase [Alteriqipengyuania flavescens]|uniref:pyridoxamine 5'-phosphate oxidase n=1 Tax=Alteriqipengyuania flavescens TaxID=3053610 RepID=UPI0025B2FC2D|nr:pyridoxamine 5'-phosphate oxidase [Alteriqipengyuania flavescens]WJY19543.1 pyridoxamine 5'-phosphate oxidase [Alteriqipengyuania flavescens]WJY25484.1 pyridoxamine 5'-phosphate oxidase [Alteriqipengyuania flavescens]
MSASAAGIPAADPFGTFDAWLAEAKDSEPNDPNAMALATATPDGAPSVRMVLLKGHGPDCGTGGGFVFYTNAESRKGGEILANRQAAMLFHWKSLRRQIRIEGPLEQVSDAMADEYFHSRHPQSQIASAASDQSRTLPSREVYMRRVAELEERYGADGPVPRPRHWTGFRLCPTRIEFWQDREYRMHERRVFERGGPDVEWTSRMLYP